MLEPASLLGWIQLLVIDMRIAFSKNIDPEMDELYPFPYQLPVPGSVKLVGNELRCDLGFPSIVNPKLVEIREDGAWVFKGTLQRSSGVMEPIEEGYYFVSDSAPYVPTI